jgi:hypothetical protein
MQVPFKFYDESKFFGDFEALPRSAQDNLLAYLDRLQKNPDSPDLHTENNSPNRFAYEFHSGYVIYCRLERAASPLTDLLGQVLRIEVLSIGPISVAHKTGLYDAITRRIRDQFGL